MERGGLSVYPLVVKRILKIAAIAIAVVVLLAGAALLALLNGGVQRALALRALPAGSALEEIRLRSSSATVSGLSLPLEGGGSVEFARAQARFDALGYLRGEPMRVENFVIEGLAIRLPEAAAAPDEPSVPIEEQIRELREQLEATPLNLVLDSLAIDGRVESDALGAFRFALDGGGLAPGKEGSLSLEARSLRPPPGLEGDFSGWSASGELAAAQTQDGRLGGLSARFETKALEAGQAAPLAEAEGEARLELGSGEGGLTAQAEARLSAERPAALFASFQGLGAVEGTVSLAIEETGGRLAITRAQASYLDTGRPVVSLNLLQPAPLFSGRVPQGQLLEATIDALPLSLFRPFAPEGVAFEGGPLTLSAKVSAEEGGRYAFAADTVDLGATSFDLDGEPAIRDLAILASLRGRVHPDGALSVETDGATLLAEGERLGELSVSGSGDFVKGKASVQAEIAADLRRLARQPILAEAMAALPSEAQGLSLETEVEASSRAVELGRTRLRVTREGERPLLELAVLRPFSLDFEAGGLNVTASEEPLAELSLANADLSLLAAYLPEGVGTSPASFEGAVAAWVRGGRVELATKGPLTLKGLDVSFEEGPMLREVDAQAELAASASGGDAELSRLSVSLAQSGRTVAAADLSGSLSLLGFKPRPETLSLKGSLEADLPRLARQPAFGDLPVQLDSGGLKATFSAAGLGESARVEAALSDLLVAGEESRAKRNARLALEIEPLGPDRWDVAADASIAKGDWGERNDVHYSGELALGEPLTFEGRLSSKRLNLAELEELAALLPEEEGAAEPPAPQAEAAGAPEAPAPGEEPPWAGLSGRLSASLGRLILPEGLEVSQIEADFALSPAAAVVDRFRASFAEGSFSGSGAARFSSASRRYTVEANLSANDVDLAPLLGPDARVRGRLGSDLRLQGSGATLAEALDQAAGRVQARGADGVITALDLQTPAAQAATIGATLLGAATDRPGVANFTAALPYFNQIDYEDMQLELRRAADGSFQLDRLRVVGPNLYLEANGRIAAGSWSELFGKPMQVQLRVGARGQLATYLDRLGLLQPSPNAQGFRMANRALSIGGSLGDPNAKSLRDYLWQAATSAALRQFAAPSGQTGGSGETGGSQPGTQQESGPQSEQPESDVERGARLLRDIFGR